MAVTLRFDPRLGDNERPMKIVLNVLIFLAAVSAFLVCLATAAQKVEFGFFGSAPILASVLSISILWGLMAIRRRITKRLSQP